MNKYQVSILRYRHSYLLNEQINVGVLLYFEQDQSVEFLYPTSLQRITSLYDDFSYTSLRKYFKSFDRQAKKITKKLSQSERSLYSIDSDKYFFKNLISRHFLIKDATALFFTNPESGINKSKSEVLNYYQKEFISVYEREHKRNRKDERYLIDKFEKKLDQNDSVLKRFFERDVTINTDHFSEQFEYGWQNGRYNLITPIGFDLTDEDYIKNKGYKWKGKLGSLTEIANKNNYKFDLIVSRPSSKKLWNTYDKVIDLIVENNAPKEIIEEEEINNYLDKAFNYFKEEEKLSKRETYHVTKTDKGWQSKKEGGSKASITGKTKKEVVKKTTNIAKKKSKSSVIIHKSDGEIQEERSYPRGSDPYPPKG